MTSNLLLLINFVWKFMGTIRFRNDHVAVILGFGDLQWRNILITRNYMQQPMPNPEDITDPTTAMNMALALMAKAFRLNYSTQTNNNQRISSNPRNRQIAQPGMNMDQDRQMQMVGGTGNQNQIRNGNLVAARAKGNLDEIEEVNANCILMANLQQASTSGTQSDKAPVYDSDGSVEVI
nr:ribonuclease H-like domain-containing protein [Tanacetum cinerariifolium]